MWKECEKIGCPIAFVPLSRNPLFFTFDRSWATEYMLAPGLKTVWITLSVALSLASLRLTKVDT